MGDNTTIPAVSEDPFSNRWGLAPSCGVRIPISTSISEGGKGGVCGISLYIAENFNDRYNFTLEMPFGTYEQKLAPSSDAAEISAQHEHHAYRFGFGKMTRRSSSYSDEGNLRLSFIAGATPMVGKGFSTITRDDYTFSDGETLSFGETSGETTEVGTKFAGAAELRPGGRFPTFEIGPAFYYGIQYGGEGSEFNRVNLELMFLATIGYGDASISNDGEIDGQLGAMGIAQGLYALGHGYLQRYYFDKAVTQPLEALDDYGLAGSSGASDRGSMADVPLLSAAAAFSGGPSFSTPLRAGSGGFWAFAGMQAVGGSLFLASESKNAKAGGAGDLLGTARMLSFAIADIETPEHRFARDPADIAKREMRLNLVHYAANTALFLIGASSNSETAMVGGASANNGIAATPNPIERSMVESTDYAWVPTTAYSGKRTGNRAGMQIHNSWHDMPSEHFQLYSSILFLSPMATMGNLGRVKSQTETYANVMLPSDVSAGLGLEGDWTWFRISFGMQTVAIFGGEDDARGAVGGNAAMTLKLPLNGEQNGTGLAFGIGGNANHVVGQGGQFEVIPTIALTVPSTDQ
jgi:hypothetical protein